MKNIFVVASVLLINFVAVATWAQQLSTGSSTQASKQAEIKAYYGEEFYKLVLNKAKDAQAKEALKKILKSGHVADPASGYDKIVPSCDSLKGCYQQIITGYGRAREFLFGKFYLVKLDASNYGIKEMYCDRIYQKEDFTHGDKPGPGIIPDNTIINVEHTWPQSRFSGRYSKELQKSDLHHLFPTDSSMNSLRGNTIFGEVEHDHGHTKCNASRYGSGSAGGMDIFEPPSDHKGHVARALMYFSIRYDMPIRPEEENVLKKWNQEHPVDDEEALRNEEIAKIQGNRNPFIDFPTLAGQISDF